jgi:hypothetical protein
MATLEEARDKIRRLLPSDPTGVIYTDDLLLDAIHAGLNEALAWVPKNASESLTGDGEETEFELPDDLYRITSVYDTYEGAYVPQSLMSGEITKNDWVEYPEGYISFSQAPQSTVIVYYGASWPLPVKDKDPIEVPDWLIRTISFYAASYALLKGAVDGANLNQFDVRTVDSGTPLMNPLLDMSTHYYERFVQAMKTIPARMRARG